jgi:hypothetical protein
MNKRSIKIVCVVALGLLTGAIRASVCQVQSVSWGSYKSISLHEVLSVSERRLIEPTEYNQIATILYEEQLGNFFEIDHQWLDSYKQKISKIASNAVYGRALDCVVSYCKQLQFKQARQVIEKYAQELSCLYGVQRSIDALWQLYNDAYATVFDTYGIPRECAHDSLYEKLPEAEKIALLHSGPKIKSFVIDLALRYKIKKQVIDLLKIEGAWCVEIDRILYAWIDRGLSLSAGISLTASFTDSEQDSQLIKTLYRAFYTDRGVFKLLSYDTDMFQDLGWPQGVTTHNTPVRHELNALLVLVPDEQSKSAIRQAFKYLCQATKNQQKGTIAKLYRRLAKRMRQTLIHPRPFNEVLACPDLCREYTTKSQKRAHKALLRFALQELASGAPRTCSEERMLFVSKLMVDRVVVIGQLLQENDKGNAEFVLDALEHLNELLRGAFVQVGQSES